MVTDLLFYEALGGVGEFYTNFRGSLNLLRTHTGWQSAGIPWTHIIPGRFGGSDFTDLLFYDSAGTGAFYTTDGHGGIDLLRTHTGWQSAGIPWTHIIPGIFAPLRAVRLHLKILDSSPDVPIATQVSEMRDVYISAGLRVIIGSTETLNLPQLLDADVGECAWQLYGDNITGDTWELYKHRNGVGKDDIVIYFVRSTIPPYGGCAHHPDGKPGAIVARRIWRYTLPDEVGHVLGLGHSDNSDNVMFQGAVTNPPPNLTVLQKYRVLLSEYTFEV